MCFFCFFFLNRPIFAEEIDEFDKKYKFIAEEPGVQRLYLDTKNIVKNKNIASIAMINLFIKGGKLHRTYKSQFSNQNPSYSISEMEFDCKSMKIRVKEFRLYNIDNRIITNYFLDKQWNQVRLKNTTDKFIFDTACK